MRMHDGLARCQAVRDDAVALLVQAVQCRMLECIGAMLYRNAQQNLAAPQRFIQFQRKAGRIRYRQDA